MKKILLFSLLCCAPLWAADEAPEVIANPGQARTFVLSQAPGLSENACANLVRYAYDPEQGGVVTEDLQRAIRAAQWQVYQRYQEISALPQSLSQREADEEF